MADGRREAEARLARWGEGRPPAELARVVAGDPETVLARLRALGDAGAAWCVLATVGGPGAEARALLADAAGLPGASELVERESKFGRPGQSTGKYLRAPIQIGKPSLRIVQIDSLV